MNLLRVPKAWHQSALRRRQFLLVILGMGVLLVVQWLLETRLSTTMNGSHFVTGDGRMAEAVVRTGYRFAAFLDLTNLNPLQGIGSQLLPINVWINPVHWPLAFIDGKSATDIAGLVGLTCVAAACYFMARCFDLPPLPSIIAAQLSLVLFGPVGPLLTFTASFVLLPGMAAVYAAYIAALGLLARVDPDRVKKFILYSAAIAALIFYSVATDPLWSTVAAISWAVPFALVALSPLRIKAVILRCAALVISFALLLGSGALLYIYTLTQYTARVYFSALLERRFAPSYVSILLSSPYGKYYYELCILGWVIGLVSAVGRVRVLVVTGSAAFISFLFYAVAFVLLDVNWWLPLPFYVEHSLAPLFMVSAVAGYWSAGEWIIRGIPLSQRTLLPSVMDVRLLAMQRWFLPLIGSAREFIRTCIRPPLATATPNSIGVQRPAMRAWLLFMVGLVAVAVVPIGSALFARERAKIVLAQYYTSPWPNEPELAAYLLQSTGLSTGRAYRGSSLFLPDDTVSVANLWKRGVPTINEYSQLVTPQQSYIEGALIKGGAGLNTFGPWIGPGGSYETLFKTLQAMGVRHILHYGPLDAAENRNLPSVTVPRRSPDEVSGAKPAKPRIWQIYELPDPNIGNYSPTEIVVADSGPDIVAILNAEDFDFRRRVVLSSGGLALVPARDTRLTVNRGGGFHVYGKSDGVSLIILPQQFSHCMKTSDSEVRIVRADLLWLGVIFSGSIDTDISFGYGVFSPECRRVDMADMKRLGIVLPVPPAAGMQGPAEKLQASVNAFKSLW
jgi:hypothetical protein